MACLLHHLYETVEAHPVVSVGECGEYVGVECPCRCVCVAFDAWNLHESAYGVARHAEMVFKPHFGGILYLGGASSEQLACRSCRHGACHSNLALTTNLGTGNAGVLLHYVADKTCGGKRTQNHDFRKVAAFPQMIERTWHHAAGAACGSGNDQAAGSVLFAHGEGIGEREASVAQVVFESLRLHMVGGRLAAQV